MYGALGAGCTAPQAKNELTLEMASFPSSSPVTSNYSSRLSGCSSPTTPTIFYEFRQIRVYLEHRGGAHGLRPQLSSPPSGCAVCPVSQLSISSCPNPRPKCFLPCLQTVVFSSSRQQTFQLPRLLSRRLLPAMQARRDESIEGRSKREVLFRVVNAGANQANGEEMIPLEALGRIPLNEVSPKKTLEGAAVGLSSAVTVAVVLAHWFQWPLSFTSVAALALLVFMGSLFGDLTESLIKRDAGVEDSGKLIPGHGGILDRVHSYIFTVALVYSFVKIGLPLFGV